MNEHDKDPFKARVKELLNENTASLDADTQGRLQQARLRAIARLRTAEDVQRKPLWFSLVPAGAVAAGLMAVVIYLDQVQPPLPEIYQDPEQQAAAENMELLENLEFTAWLALREGT